MGLITTFLRARKPGIRVQIPRQFTIRTLLVVLTLLGFVFRYAANRYSEAAAVRDLEHRGAACFWIPRAHGAWGYCVYLPEEWNGSDADLRILKRLSNKVTDVALQNRHITNSTLRTLRGLQRLQRLDIIGCTVNDGAIREIAAIEALRVANLFDTGISDGGIAELRRRRADVHVATQLEIKRNID